MEMALLQRIFFEFICVSEQMLCACYLILVGLTEIRILERNLIIFIIYLKALRYSIWTLIRFSCSVKNVANTPLFLRKLKLHAFNYALIIKNFLLKKECQKQVMNIINIITYALHVWKI